MAPIVARHRCPRAQPARWPLFILSALAALAPPAHAAQPETPYLWTYAQAGGGGWPSGVIGDVRMQARAPLYRSDSMLLADTYVGAGARVAVTPAFIQGGPRLSIAPAAFFDMDVDAEVHRYFPGPFGALGFDAPAHKLESERGDRKDETFPATAWTLSAAPTLKLQVGPVVAVDALVVEAWHVDQPADQTSPYVYEALRDLVIAWDDVVIENEPILLLTAWKGDDHHRLLWVGATLRDRMVLVAGDRSMVVGPMALFRPGSPSNAVPMFALQVLPYVIDADRVGGVPNIQAAAWWTLESPFRALTHGS